MKIVFLDASTVGGLPNISRLDDFGEFIQYATTSPNERLQHIGNADIIITNKVVIDEEIMSKSSNLKLICVAATGMNNVDLEFAKAHHIAVKNAAGYSSTSVAQSTFAMILYLINRVDYYDQYVKSGEYIKSNIFTHYGPEFWEISGKTFGIIGLGNIGGAVAKIAEAFGAQVIYYSTSGKNTDQPYPCVTLEELLRRSDIVSIHAPLNENTKNLIRLEQIKIMKPHAIIVNSGRGGIINENDLAKALDKKIIGGTGIDVFEREPIDAQNPLLKVKYPERLVMQPHIAWASKESRVKLMDIVAENIADFLKSQPDI